MEQETIRADPDPLAPLIAALHGEGRLRVWSILISAFGDLMLPRCARVQAGALQAVMDRLGIGSGAVRTALSRLAKEGWITRVRDGRTVAYGLSARASETFQLASHGIYARRRPEPAHLPLLIVLPDGAEPAPDPDLVMLRRGAGLWLSPAPCPYSKTALCQTLDPAQVPDWVRAALAPDALRAQLLSIEAVFTPVLRHAVSGVLSPRDAVAARVALIHAWRRAALRHPAIAGTLLPPDWPEPRCRALVLDLHTRLGEIGAGWLDEHLPLVEELLRPDV